MPVTLVGVNLNGKVNDITIVHVGIMDLSKVQPILFIMHDRSDWRLEQQFATAWSVRQASKSH